MAPSHFLQSLIRASKLPTASKTFSTAAVSTQLSPHTANGCRIVACEGDTDPALGHPIEFICLDKAEPAVCKLIGTYGFINVTSYKGLQAGNGVDTATADDVGRLKVQDVGEGSIKIRLYEGRMAQGPHRGTPLIFKVYPGKRAAGVEADMMAANELNAHAYLQEDSIDHFQNIQILLGGFETSTGEQLLYGTINGIAFMHDLDRLHQSVGPASIVLNTITEREAAYVIPRLRDLAFSVDIRYSSLIESPDVLSEALWRRANNAGVYTPAEKRVFGIADDMYEVGLLFAYLAFVPFCEAGIMDGLSLQVSNEIVMNLVD
ncbi:unnamed protein product [Rhodiola kirilowii]